MSLLAWMPAATLSDLAWTLLHFLWQGLLLAALLEVSLPLLKGARARHNAALATLILMAAAPLATFLLLHGQGQAVPGAGEVLQLAGATVAIAGNTGAPSSITGWTGWMVLLWLAGIAALSLRALGGWYLAEGLRRRDTLALPEEMLARFHALAQRLEVSRPVRLFQSHRVDVPVVIGWFRPVILVPVAALAGLAPQQLEALVMHELAHIRRHDAFINILLLAAETLLFYHPAIWWVSRRVRIERENCCDDLAVRHCGDAVLYVEAMTMLAGGRMPVLVLGADGGSLKDRAARLLGVPSDGRRYSLPALAGLVIAGLAIGTVAMAQPEAPALVTDVGMLVQQGAAPPLNIQAASMRTQTDSSGIRAFHYEGNAVVKQGDITIRAAGIRAEVGPSAVPGTPGKLTRLIADGNVEVTAPGRTMRGDHMELAVGEKGVEVASGRFRGNTEIYTDRLARLTAPATPVPPMPPSLPGTMKLARLLLPLPTGAPQQAIDNTMKIAMQIREMTGSCAALGSISQDPLLKGSVFTQPHDYVMAELHPELQKTLAQTGPGQIAMPVMIDTGVFLFARCG